MEFCATMLWSMCSVLGFASHLHELEHGILIWELFCCAGGILFVQGDEDEDVVVEFGVDSCVLQEGKLIMSKGL